MKADECGYCSINRDGVEHREHPCMPVGRGREPACLYMRDMVRGLRARIAELEAAQTTGPRQGTGDV
jgi:hypothetical protein